MKKYIGTKLVMAEPAWRVTIPGKEPFIAAKTMTCPYGLDTKIENGYKLLYPDGYESWSPKEVFEKAYRPADGMPFGLAIEAAKMGKKIARKGWNGKSQHVELATCISYCGL